MKETKLKRPSSSSVMLEKIVPNYVTLDNRSLDEKKVIRKTF